MTKISALPEATAANDSDLLEIVQAGANRRVTVGQLGDVIAETLPPPEVDWGSITGKPDFDALYVNVAGDTMTGALAGTSATMSSTITSTGGNIVASGGGVYSDRSGDAATANIVARADPGFSAALSLNSTVGAASNRWILQKTATAEAGANAGSNLQITSYDDAGVALANPLIINRATSAVTLGGDLAGTAVTMSGAIITTGSYMMVDRSGDAANAFSYLRTDTGFQGEFQFTTGTSARWGLRKTTTAEGGSNAGSNFQLVAYSDAGASLGSAIQVTRAGLATTLGGPLTTLSGTAVGAGANTQAFIKASSTANLGIYYGTGDPTFSAAKGSLYSKTDATTTTTRLWVNTDGSTTWTNLTTAA